MKRSDFQTSVVLTKHLFVIVNQLLHKNYDQIHKKCDLINDFFGCNLICIRGAHKRTAGRSYPLYYDPCHATLAGFGTIADAKMMLINDCM